MAPPHYKHIIDHHQHTAVFSVHCQVFTVYQDIKRLVCSVTITITISATILTNLIMCLWCSVWLCHGTFAALNIVTLSLQSLHSSSVHFTRQTEA